MNIVSSHRPHNVSGEYRRNQVLAKNTWEGICHKITYFGEHEPELGSYKTTFVPSEQWPKIKALAECAGNYNGLTAILNADIVLTPTILGLERQMRLKRHLCASSRRWAFRVQGHTLSDMVENAELGDERGRDIFVAGGVVWRHLANEIPDGYRIGNPYWDAFITDFFRQHYDASFVDFTSWRCVFHPIHGERNYPFAEQAAKADLERRV